MGPNSVGQKEIKEEMTRSWKCKRCTMKNEPGIRICSHCNKAQEITTDEDWICGKCTLQNGPHSNICLACDAPRQLAFCHQSDDDESTVSAEQSDDDQSGVKEWVCDKCTFINEPQAIVCECRRTKIMAMGGWECKSCRQPVPKIEEKCDCGHDRQGRVDRPRRGKNKTTKQQISEDADQADQETGPHNGAPGEDGEENCDMEVEAEDAEHNEQATLKRQQHARMHRVVHQNRREPVTWRSRRKERQ